MSTLLIANWKMNLSRFNSITLARTLAQLTKLPPQIHDVLIALAPPFITLGDIGNEILGSNIQLAAQDCSAKEEGAYTGDVSAKMLTEYGCQYVILGHSERREHQCETSQLISEKVKLACKYNLIPVLCIGETIEDKEQNRTLEALEYKLLSSLPSSITSRDKIVISYEPVWAIGTGEKPSTNQISTAINFIRKTVRSNFSLEETKLQMLYGGSVTPDNSKEILQIPNVEGLLIGGASLVYEKFIRIIQASLELNKIPA